MATSIDQTASFFPFEIVFVKQGPVLGRCRDLSMFIHISLGNLRHTVPACRRKLLVVPGERRKKTIRPWLAIPANLILCNQRFFSGGGIIPEFDDLSAVAIWGRDDTSRPVHTQAHIAGPFRQQRQREFVPRQPNGDRYPSVSPGGRGAASYNRL